MEQINTRPCPCCGQDRLYPTEPGFWEYKDQMMTYWKQVETAWVYEPSEAKYLGIFELDGTQIWWPNNVKWQESPP
jgi:hypothetical protein